MSLDDPEARPHRWSDISLRAKGLVVVSIPLGVMLLAFFFSYVVNRQQDEASMQVQQSLLLHAKSDGLLDAFAHAKTGVCAYLVDHNEAFLEPLQLAARSLPRTAAQLVTLTRGSQKQAEQLQQVRVVCEDNLAWMTALVQRAQAAEVTTGQATTEADVLAEGARRMTLLHARVGELVAEEERLLDERTQRLQRIERWRSVGNCVGAILGLLGAFIAVQLFTRGIARRIMRLRDSANRLVEDKPLERLPTEQDEIGVFGQHLTRVGILLLERSRALNESFSRLRQSEKFYRSLARNFPNGSVFLFDRELRFLVADGRGLTRDALSPADLEGRTVRECFPEATAAQLEPLYRVALAGTSLTNEITYAGRLYSLQTLPVFNEDGEIHAGLAVTQDITERKQAEETLRQARDEAERANDAKSEFLSRMSHELRTPLNAILGFSQLLEIDLRGERELDHLAHILRAGKHLLDLINEVLDIARIESGHMQFSMEPVAIKYVLAEAVEMVRPLANKREIQLMVAPAGEGDEGFVQADQQRLRQVVLNLLSNAIKYNRDGGEVHVRGEQGTRAGHLRIIVRDTGAGISPEKQHRLFHAFDRLDAERTRVEGTGLGLALSRHLIEAMGGSMGVESALGEGSTFWVELPRAENPVEALSLDACSWLFEADEAPKPTAVPARTVLYVEDNLSNLTLVEHLLEAVHPDIRLLSAMQGTMGLELAREHRPDLILLDVHLPDVSGHEVLLRLKAEDNLRSVPVVIMSADATPGQIDRLKAAGATAYLTKPFQVAELLSTIDELTVNHAN